MNHNEYAVSRAVSRMKMPPVREYASTLLCIEQFQIAAWLIAKWL